MIFVDSSLLFCVYYSIGLTNKEPEENPRALPLGCSGRMSVEKVDINGNEEKP